MSTQKNLETKPQTRIERLNSPDLKDANYTEVKDSLEDSPPDRMAADQSKLSSLKGARIIKTNINSSYVYKPNISSIASPLSQGKVN